MRAKLIENSDNNMEFMGDFHLELTKLLNQAMLKLPGDVIKDLVDQALDELGIDDNYAPEPKHKHQHPGMYPSWDKID